MVSLLFPEVPLLVVVQSKWPLEQNDASNEPYFPCVGVEMETLKATRQTSRSGDSFAVATPSALVLHGVMVPRRIVRVVARLLDSAPSPSPSLPPICYY
jgi:hypothetical protein